MSHQNFTEEKLPEIQKYSLKISIIKISKMLGNLEPQGSQKFMTQSSTPSPQLDGKNV